LVRKYQRDNKLTVTGNINSKLLKSLGVKPVKIHHPTAVQGQLARPIPTGLLSISQIQEANTTVTDAGTSDSQNMQYPSQTPSQGDMTHVLYATHEFRVCNFLKPVHL